MWPFSSPDSSPPSASSSSTSLTSPSASNSSSSVDKLRPILSSSDAANPALNPLNPEGIKPCCACPDTKKLRDDCFLKHGSNIDGESDSVNVCEDIVRQHKACMRSLGFNV